MNISKTTLLVSILMMSSGCMGPGNFTISEADSRFKVDGSKIISSNNNRISTRSIAGGYHIDHNGVFVNPSVGVSADGGQKVFAFNIINLTNISTNYGSPNTLGTLKEIAFLINNQVPIQLPIISGKLDIADLAVYNLVSESASKTVVESGTAPVSIRQYYDIVLAKTVAVKITGTKRSVTYEIEDIAESFLPNLRQFYKINI